jgi:alpha-glucosidase (family GH31 glycosyl hydrolase)
LPLPKVKKGRKWVPNARGTVDFSHPNAYEFMKRKYAEPLKWGVKGSMVDFGECIPADSVCYNGKSGYEMHQENTLWYNKAVAEIFTEVTGGDHILYSRSGCPGSQKYMGQFGGDQRSSYNGFTQAIYGGINDGASGYNIWGSDIGGFKGDPGFELYVHWLQFGTFSPLMRAHGFGKPRNPWEFGEKAAEIFKTYYWWRENMLDHVYSMAIEANKTAAPMMRAMVVEFPDDYAKMAEQQYMFGSEMLVAPVMEPEKQYKSISFPAGNWYSLWSGTKVQGGRNLTVNAPYTEMPVYLRAGAMMVLTLPEETLLPRASMLDKQKVQALLVTPADGDREVRHWVDKDTAYTFAVKKADDGFIVENQDGYDLKALLIYGMKPEKVLVDGKEVDFTVDDSKVTVKTPQSYKKVQCIG